MQSTRILFFILLLPFALLAQKTSKSKAADKLYEKGTLQTNVTIKNTNLINSEYLEFSPVFYQSGLVYVSSRNKKGPVDKKIGETFFELMYADTDRNGMPLKPEKFSSQINSQVHEGPVTFNQKATRIFFTRNNLKRGFPQTDSKGKVELKIYEAKKGQYDWVDVKELPFNSDEYSCMHPSLSVEEDKMYFASDMPGGFGGKDLYVVTKSGDNWGKPVNLGDKINTSGDEGFPFIHQSGSLFFASNGHEGYGGLDLFVIDLTKEEAATVNNLRVPFNSTADDLGLILNRDGTRGYFASNREDGFGKDDIYVFEAPDGIKGIEAPVFLPSTILVTDAVTQQTVGNAAVRIFERAPDGFIEGDDIYDVKLLPSKDEEGNLVMELVRKRDDDLGVPRLLTNADGVAETEFTADRQYIVLVSKENYKSAEVIFSTVDKKEPQRIVVELEPSSCLTLYGSVLSEEYNTQVANATVRLVNECDGTDEILNTNVSGKYEACLPIGCDFNIIVSKPGYETNSAKVSTVKIRGSRSLESIIKLRPLYTNDLVKEPLRSGTVIVLEKIYYDFGKSSIRAGAARELDALVELMKQYPSMEIEMVAHTDARGGSKYNLDLSLRRADSAKKYLVSRGIQSDRIKTFGYGESQPRNRCYDGVECSEEEHQYNRRTEVKIVKVNEGIDVRYQDDGPEVIDKMKPPRKKKND